MYKELLDQIIVAILIPAIPLAGYYLQLWIKKQIAALEEWQRIDRVNFYLDRVEKLIYEVVTAVSQTYVNELKSSGKFSTEAHREAFSMAREKILALTQTEGRSIIEDIYGDYEAYIALKIEEVVSNLKEN